MAFNMTRHLACNRLRSQKHVSGVCDICGHTERVQCAAQSLLGVMGSPCVSFHPQIEMGNGDAEMEEVLEQARAAAEVHASLAAQRSSSGTGEMLRSNFVVLAALVEAQDGHLLSASEKDRTAEFKVRHA